jgi:secondary thiamine-phosphate synthase enzyme
MKDYTFGREMRQRLPGLRSNSVHTFSVRTTGRCAFVDITSEVARVVRDSGVRQGLAVVFVPHTTAGVTINENADLSVRQDMIEHLDRAVPADAHYEHEEGNSPAHVKASMMGSSVTVIVAEGGLALGTWQGIYLCEFDGPRTRSVHVEVR